MSELHDSQRNRNTKIMKKIYIYSIGEDIFQGIYRKEHKKIGLFEGKCIPLPCSVAVQRHAEQQHATYIRKALLTLCSWYLRIWQFYSNHQGQETSKVRGYVLSDAHHSNGSERDCLSVCVSTIIHIDVGYLLFVRLLQALPEPFRYGTDNKRYSHVFFLYVHFP